MGDGSKLMSLAFETSSTLLVIIGVEAHGVVVEVVAIDGSTEQREADTSPSA